MIVASEDTRLVFAAGPAIAANAAARWLPPRPVLSLPVNSPSRSERTAVDGAPLTAGDFRWSWLRVLKPENASRYASLISPIENAEVIVD